MADLNQILSKLEIQPNSDKSYSYSGRPDFEAPQKDIVDLKPRVNAPRNVSVQKKNNSYS
jgi:hypothetical protein